ncbi:MAG TPA: N-acetylmuramoyl-L-alanine amidase [Xanthobacteraceae bacterium]|jgi:N-acetylmuramoyl-L-alanine amidase|nr:N-acetylmuramoyl-L-alanine amidase [Xanthobacteraceae bacterium]
MSVRAAILVCLFGAAVLGGASAAERTGASGPPIGAAADFPVASDVRLGGDDTQTRLIIDLSRKIDIRSFTLANPYRVVMDMPQVTFQFPAKAGEVGRGLIKAFRFGLVMQGGSRMVIDLARPAQVDMAFVLDAINDQPARLVLHLTATDRDSFMRSLALDSGAPQRSKPDAPVEIKPNGDSRPLIVVDPGHGGIDNGTRAASGEMEKSIVLEFSLLLRDKIEKTGKYRVLMTRTDDTFVALGERVQFARARQAALFISIHADALRRREGDAQGATVYTLSERASDARAARLAEAENRADVIAGLDLSTEEKDVADILVDLARRETKTFSMQFAQTVVGTLKNAARLHQHPLKSASFVVLKAPDVPSVLVELGYVSNKADLKSLISAEWRDHTADAIVKAVDAFLSPRLAGNGQRSGQN